MYKLATVTNAATSIQIKLKDISKQGTKSMSTTSDTIWTIQIMQISLDIQLHEEKLKSLWTFWRLHHKQEAW
jgi:hypothetical protein